ncbi:hypothetical protein OG21DRAFT_1513295 [Imleria badia]|nr:hypothetical protein OG21DRAFT_1513295 [Imleria badia]
MPKPIPSFGQIFAPSPSQPLYPLHAPQVAGMTWLSASHLQHDQQEQRTLTRSADFPELYIGPPRRAPGRPEGSTSKSKAKSQASTSLLGADSSKAVESKSKSEEVRRKPKQKTKPRPPPAPPTYSPFTSGPLTRHTPTGGLESGAPGIPTFYHQPHPIYQAQSHAQLYPQTQPYFDPRRNPLLGLLSGIQATSSGNTGTNAAPDQQAVLLSALQGLLASNPHLLQLAATNVGLSTDGREQAVENKANRGGSHADDEYDDADSDIVALDSSTIDTAAFRKASHRHLAASDTDTSPRTTNQEYTMPRSLGTHSSPLPASTPPSGQDGTPASSQTSTLTVIPEAETPTSKHLSSGQPDRENVTLSHALDMPSTPTPSRTRKRKLDEYNEANSPSPVFPPSPSPTVVRTSSSRKALATKRALSSPTGGITSWSSPPMRLPSMLGSMRGMATSGSRLQSSTLSSSTHERLVTSASNKNGNQSTALVSGPSKSNTDHPGNTEASSNVASDTTTLKRRRTLNLTEFMEECEARKNAKVRKRPSSGHKLEVAMHANASQAAPPRSAKIPSTSRHSQSSPPRALFRSDPVPSSLPALMRPPSLAPLDPPMTTSTCMAPPTSTSTAAPTQNPLKNFVVPAWARTSTAMLPRLSDEVLARQRAEREAKKAQVSLRRREAKKAKRKRLRGADYPSKESSDDDDDDDAVGNDPTPWTHPSSSIARSAPLAPPPLPTLPIFASDAVEPIPSSPPQSHRQLVPHSVPSTPPRKPVSPASAPHRTPSKSGSCSLFTPSGQDQEPLFTPSTPSVTRSLTRVTFTPRSPTVLHHSGARKSPRKSVPQTPKRSANHPTPKSARSGRNVPFASPSFSMRTPLTQTAMGTRAFLLPPPSPTLRTPHPRGQVRSKMIGSSTPLVPVDSGIVNQQSPPNEQNFDRDTGSKEEDVDMFGRKPGDGVPEENMSTTPGQRSPTRPTVDDDGQGTSELGDVTSNGDAPQAGEEYASSPLPPSSPLPASPISSPTKHHDSDFEMPTMNNLLVPDSDILLPSASDSDRPQGVVDTARLSDDACTASWFTDSEASAWLTETEAWLTDTEGGPLRTDSDGAWLSDSDAVFGDMSSLPPSSASNWLSDDADVDTDCEVGGMDGPGGGFDTAAFERAFAALVERGGRGVVDKNEGGDSQGTRAVESELWESLRPLLGSNALNDTGTATGDVGESVDADKVAQDIQELLNSLVGT